MAADSDGVGDGVRGGLGAGLVLITGAILCVSKIMFYSSIVDASRVFRRGDAVVVQVRGAHDAKDAEPLANEVERLVGTGCCEIVVDLTGLESYTRAARQVWQDRLSAYAGGFTRLTLVGGTPLARMASAAVCLYAGIKMRSVESLDEAV